MKHEAEQFEFEFMKEIKCEPSIRQSVKEIVTPIFLDWPKANWREGRPVINTKAVAKINFV